MTLIAQKIEAEIDGKPKESIVIFETDGAGGMEAVNCFSNEAEMREDGITLPISTIGSKVTAQFFERTIAIVKAKLSAQYQSGMSAFFDSLKGA